MPCERLSGLGVRALGTLSCVLGQGALLPQTNDYLFFLFFISEVGRGGGVEPNRACRSVTCDGQSHPSRDTSNTISCFMPQKPELRVMGYEPVGLENLYLFSSCVV